MKPPVAHSNTEVHLRLIANSIASLYDGQVDSLGTVTLTANATETVVNDPRVTPASVIFLSPLSSAAASEPVYVSSKEKGSFTLSHSSSTEVRSYDFVMFTGVR